ncbi:GLPGLI family protein [Aquimarina sp. MMG015]|uniref:GLPGLI family protein n=1 Tax=Aquimarina sp. MMG015 TaxID=2822689 RepID=UPI001B3A3A4F|nr:GLPGLI family protein [Aquimarina sp. MMG015]MBQ4803085.1 GLPGLI family protein [Aquimarina sp. MMG015]
MIKRTFLFFFIITSNINSYGQEKDKYSGRITYEEIYRNPEMNIKEKTLYFNKEQSYFEWFEKSKNVKTLQDGSTIYPSNTDSSIERTSRFQLHNHKNKEFYIRLFNRNKERLVKNTYHRFNWELLEETKKIDRFTCQRAETVYKGRTYIAWFTNEIPAPFGPAMFHGLGGMILELYEENQILYYLAKSISINTEVIDIKGKVKGVNFSKAISEEEYNKIAKQETKELESRLNASRPKGSSPIRLSGGDCDDCGERLDKEKTKDNDKKN